MPRGANVDDDRRQRSSRGFCDNLALQSPIRSSLSRSSVSRLRAAQQRHRKSARAHIASGFGFWDNTAGFDISQTLIHYSSHVDLWPRLLGRPAQHAAGGRPRHRVRHHPRLHHRHRAAVEKLAGVAISPPAMSRPSAISRCCCNCCSGTTPCSRRCRICATASPFLGSFLNNRGLFLPPPMFAPASARWWSLSLGFIGAIAFYLWARRRQEAPASRRRFLW